MARKLTPEELRRASVDLEEALQQPPAAPEQEADPNHISIYGTPEEIKKLDPRQQMIANINRAKNGLMVDGSQIRTMEMILEGAGYRVTHDGQFSADELQALQHFKDTLEDKNFKEAAITFVKGIACVATLEALLSLPANDPTRQAYDRIMENIPRAHPAPGMGA